MVGQFLSSSNLYATNVFLGLCQSLRGMRLSNKQARRLLRALSRGMATSSSNGEAKSSTITESSVTASSASSANLSQRSPRSASPSESDDSMDRTIPESFWNSKVPIKLYPRSKRRPDPVDPHVPPSTVSTHSVASTSSSGRSKQVWTYKGVTRPYHLPSPGDRGPYYVVVKGRHYGVHRGWYAALLLTLMLLNRVLGLAKLRPRSTR
jgi:hypothetical protein